MNAREKAEAWFEEYDTHGYGCCFEYPSIKKMAIKNIKALIRESKREGMEEAAKIADSWANSALNKKKEVIDSRITLNSESMCYTRMACEIRQAAARLGKEEKLCDECKGVGPHWHSDVPAEEKK